MCEKVSWKKSGEDKVVLEKRKGINRSCQNYEQDVGVWGRKVGGG